MEKGPRGCGCFEALRSFPSKAHKFPATSLQARAELSASASPSTLQLLPQQSPPQPPTPTASPHAMEAHGTPSPATQPQPLPFTLPRKGVHLPTTAALT